MAGKKNSLSTAFGIPMGNDRNFVAEVKRLAAMSPEDRVKTDES